MIYFVPLQYNFAYVCVLPASVCHCFGHLVGRGVEGQRSSSIHPSVFGGLFKLPCFLINVFTDTTVVHLHVHSLRT